MNRTLQLIVISVLATSFSGLAQAQCNDCFGWPSQSGGSYSGGQNYYSNQSSHCYQPAWRSGCVHPLPQMSQRFVYRSNQFVTPQHSTQWSSDCYGSSMAQMAPMNSMPLNQSGIVDGSPIVEGAGNSASPSDAVAVPGYEPAVTTEGSVDDSGPTLAPPSPSGNRDEVVLFDGSSLDSWRGYKEEAIGEGWKIDGEVLKFDGSGGGDIITKETFENFEFTFEWAVTEAANSGIMYRVGLGDGAPYLTGPEYQILDDSKHADGKNSLTSAASLYGLYDRGETQTKPVGEWNTGKIVINNNKVQHWLNGQLAVETEIGSEEWKEKVGNSKFKDWEKFGVNSAGHLCLQDHGDEVWYRNLKVKRLPGN